VTMIQLERLTGGRVVDLCDPIPEKLINPDE